MKKTIKLQQSKDTGQWTRGAKEQDIIGFQETEEERTTEIKVDSENPK